MRSLPEYLAISEKRTMVKYPLRGDVNALGNQEATMNIAHTAACRTAWLMRETTKRMLAARAGRALQESEAGHYQAMQDLWFRQRAMTSGG